MSDAPCTLFWPRSGCSPLPGRPTLPVIAHSAIRQRALSVPVVCWEIPMPQKMIPARASPQTRATSPDHVGGHAGDLLAALRRVVGHGGAPARRSCEVRAATYSSSTSPSRITSCMTAL